MTATLRCPGCLLAALLISAAVHLALAGALMWSAPGEGAPDPGQDELGVTLAMFADPGPAGGVARVPGAPLPPDPDLVPEPEGAAEPTADLLPKPAVNLRTPPEPTPEPAMEAAPPVPASAPAPAPRPAAKPKPKPARATKVAKAKPGQAPVPAVTARPLEGTASGGSGSQDATAAVGRATGGANVAAVEGEYLRGLQQAIGRNRFYPQGARRQDLTGVVAVAFTIHADGRLDDIRVSNGSGFDVLDQAALETLRRLGSYKPIPPVTGRSRWPVRVPIVFDLR